MGTFLVPIMINYVQNILTVAVIMLLCPKIEIHLGMEGVPIPLVQFLHKNLCRSTVVKFGNYLCPII